MTHHQHLLRFAVELAHRAAELALARQREVLVSAKPDTSVVTQADLEVQHLLQETIARDFPDHAVIAEEHLPDAPDHASRAEARYCWVIDPIDGTRNYAAGIPCFCTSIALLDQAEPVVGVVLEHNAGTLFTAVAGAGAWMGDRRLQVCRDRAYVDQIIGLPSDHDPITLGVLQAWSVLPGIVFRNLGTAALHLALVAAGALDGTFCKRAHIWDIAAGALLVREAGGVFGNPLQSVASDVGSAANQPGGGWVFPFPFHADRNPAEETPIVAATPELYVRLMDSFRSDVLCAPDRLPRRTLGGANRK